MVRIIIIIRIKDEHIGRPSVEEPIPWKPKDTTGFLGGSGGGGLSWFGRKGGGRFWRSGCSSSTSCSGCRLDRNGRCLVVVNTGRSAVVGEVETRSDELVGVGVGGDVP